MAQQPPTTYNAPSPSLDQHPDPTSTLVSLSALDFLLIELVPMAYRIAFDLAAREEAWLSNPSTAAISKAGDAEGGGGAAAGGAGGGGGASSISVTGEKTVGPATTIDEEEAREAVFHRLESLGYRVGLGIVER